MKHLNNYDYKIPKIWLYEVKGLEDVATLEEIEIAKKLSETRAKLFLESRYYIRLSLSTLFNKDPLKIPIDANPGEPPKLPIEMGNISLSHCKDAIVVAWHRSKIGIDIERRDRNFNYIKIFEKYFTHTNKSKNYDNLSRTNILNQWCAVEAAIKCDHGRLAKDLENWQYFENKKKLIHKKKNLHLNFSQINFHNWTITLVCKEKNFMNRLFICSSKIF